MELDRVRILAALTALLPLALGLGYREFGEPCEPPRSLIVDNYGRVYYGNQQQPGNYIERSSPSYPPPQHQGQPYPQPGQSYQGQTYQQNGQPYRPAGRHYADNYQNQRELEQRYEQLSREVNETRRCRSERGLRCDPYTRSCKCFETAGASWSIERERCEFKELGTFCSARITEYAQYCTEFAQCTCNWQHWDRRRWYPCESPPAMDHHTLPGPHEHDTNNGKCLCQPGYRANEDNSGCWYSTASHPHAPSTVNLLLAIIILLVSGTAGTSGEFTA